MPWFQYIRERCLGRKGGDRSSVDSTFPVYSHPGLVYPKPISVRLTLLAISRGENGKSGVDQIRSFFE
jgi:hypothetical protein